MMKKKENEKKSVIVLIWILYPVILLNSNRYFVVHNHAAKKPFQILSYVFVCLFAYYLITPAEAPGALLNPSANL